MNIKLDDFFFTLFIFQDNGVDLLGIRSPNPPKYTLALMDALFTDEEMATKCYIVLSKKGTKSPLSSEKKKLIEGMNKIDDNLLIVSFKILLKLARFRLRSCSYLQDLD